MEDISIIHRYKSQCESNISDLKSKLSKYQKSYNSLKCFNQQVKKSQQEFNHINSGKKSLLLELEGAKKNCVTAQKYYSGMKRTLNNIGSKIIGAVFLGLLGEINIKLRFYLKNIDSMNSQIKYYVGEIDKCNRKISMVREKNDE